MKIVQLMILLQSIDNLNRCYFNPLKNRLAVKKGAAQFKNGQCEKSCEIKGAAKKWL